ncbi:HTH-type transcriptional activator mta [bioreactor metagenome]|uniref:HTH-type transcriptional activator mta n=1 Tax=bioreactor metagenome TaxID=1076179 RepID=A0A644TDC6_9ZZZZ|nr:MerR family transcriptional regulator [Dehalococcoides sp.]MEA4879085.1 MerR family transcriptional regulator [Dehalococcoides mccartyi]POZ59703.1 transcriptional regulator, MerR family [Dehalococcoides mccartyi]
MLYDRVMEKLLTVGELAKMAGVSIRTLRFYDVHGLLKPRSYTAAGYRQYGRDEALRLQQILFYRELGFSLEEVKKLVDDPAVSLLENLRRQSRLLKDREKQLLDLQNTIQKTISSLEGKIEMEINEYYQGLPQEKIDYYRREARRRYGEETVQRSEEMVVKMGKTKMAELQAQGQSIFEELAENIPGGPAHPIAQELISKWQKWLENFARYTDEGLLGLARGYRDDPEFKAFFDKIHPGLAAFIADAAEVYFKKSV